MPSEYQDKLKNIIQAYAAEHNYPEGSYGESMVQLMNEAASLDETKNLTVELDDGSVLYATFEPSSISKTFPYDPDGNHDKTRLETKLFGDVSFALFKKDNTYAFGTRNAVNIKDFTPEKYPEEFKKGIIGGIQHFVSNENSLSLGVTTDKTAIEKALFLDKDKLLITPKGKYAESTFGSRESDTFSTKSEGTLRRTSFGDYPSDTLSFNLSNLRSLPSMLFNNIKYSQEELFIDTETSNLKELKKRGNDFFQRVNNIVIEKLENVGLKSLAHHVNSGEDEGLPHQAINFLISSPNKDVAFFRLEFLKKTYELLNGKPLSDFSQLANKKEWEKIHLLLRRPKDFYDGTGNIRNELIFSEIDAGRYPAIPIATQYGFPNIKKKQFELGMKYFGEKHIPENHSLFDPSAKLTFANAKKAFAFSKIPQEWLTIKKDTPLFSIEGHKYFRLFGGDGLDRTKDALITNLQTVGEKIELLDKKGVDGNAEKKQISRQWSWLSSSSLTLGEKLTNFNKKYKMEESFSDYSSMLGDYLDAVFIRLLKDHNHIDFSECITVDIDESTLEYEESEISEKIRTHINENDDNFDYEEEEENLFLGFIGDCEPDIDVPKGQNLKGLLYKNSISLKEMAEKNLEMHKNHNKLVKQANKGYNVDLAWTPFLNEPIVLGGKYEISSVSNRLDLLEEGEEMQHCVFSYLQNCLNGDSIILSARDLSDPEKPRVATIEVTYDELDDPDDNNPDNNAPSEPSYEYSIEQCFGHHNETNKKTKEVSYLLEEWLKKATEGLVPTNIQGVVEQEMNHLNQDVLYNAELRPLEHGGIMKAIPFEGDGAYLSYYAFNEYSVGDMSVLSVLEDNMLSRELFYEGSFREEIELIEKIAGEWNYKPVDVVNYKIDHGIKGVNELRGHRKQQLVLSDPLKELVERCRDSLSPEQIRTQCDEILSNEGVFLDFDGNESALLSPSFDWAKFIKKLPEPTTSNELDIANDNMAVKNTMSMSSPRI